MSICTSVGVMLLIVPRALPLGRKRIVSSAVASEAMNNEANKAVNKNRFDMATITWFTKNSR